MFFRRLIKVFNRYLPKKWFFAKRQRNPSTFQECVQQGTPERSRIYLSLVFFLLVLFLVIYYILSLYRMKPGIEPVMESVLKNHQKMETDPVSGENTLVPEEYGGNPIKIKKGPQRKLKKKHFDYVDGLPLCTTVTVNSTENGTLLNGQHFIYVSIGTKSDKIAQDLDIRMGGHHVPKGCRPRYKVAILVPYWWNRKRHLKIFLYYIHPFLVRQRLEYRIFVIEQHGVEPVNKGRLYNAGFLEIQKKGDWQCVIFHDVDLLPVDNRIRYTCPVLPRHMCASIVGMENAVKYSSVFGGVAAMTMWHYKKANGYSNSYWGKGESEDMFKRLQTAGIGVTRYKKNIAQYISLKHSVMPDNPKRIELLQTAEKRYKSDGLSTLTYNVASYASFPLYTHIVVNVNNVKKPPDYVTEASITLSP